MDDALVFSSMCRQFRNYGRIITRRIHAVGSRDDCMSIFGEQKYRAPYFLISLPPIHPRAACGPGMFGLRARTLVGCVTATQLTGSPHPHTQPPPDKPDPARVSHPTGTGTFSLSAGTDKNRTRARLHFVQLLHLSTDLLTRCFHGSWDIRTKNTSASIYYPTNKNTIHGEANASRAFRGEMNN